MPGKPVATRSPGHVPREALAPALTIHRGHKRQVENLPDQHLHEANLQGKNENSTQATVHWDPQGSFRPCLVAGEEGAELLGDTLGTLWELAVRAPVTAEPQAGQLHVRLIRPL